MNRLKDFSINKKHHSVWKYFVGIIVLVILLYVSNIFISPIKGFFYALSSPFQKIFWSAGESSSLFFSSLFSGRSISKENRNLKEENQKLLAQIAILQTGKEGEIAQSEVLDVCQSSNFKLLMAKVNGLEKDIISIDKGSNDGIFEEMPVINQQKVLIGKVFKVYPKFSQVMLVSNKNSTIVVDIKQSDITLPSVNGIVRGIGGLDAYLDSVRVDNNINIGDIIMTSATDPTFPADLLVGKVLSVEKDDQKSFQQAQIKLFFDIKLDNLFVITNYKQAN